MYWSKNLYKIDVSEEVFDNRLKALSLTFKQEKNSFSSHVKDYVFRYGIGEGEEVLRGEINKDEFTVWRKDRMLDGIFYPIFEGKKIKIDTTDVLEIKTRFNPVAEKMVLIVGTVLFLAILFGIVIQANNELKFLFKRSLIGVILFLLFQAIPIISFYTLKHKTLKRFKRYFELTEIK